jgi:hypothetical protein
MAMGGQVYTPAALPPGKEPRYILSRRLGGRQDQPGLFGEENMFSATAVELPVIQLIT